MVEHEVVETWFYGLSDDQRGVVRSFTGAMPRWMAESLRDSGIDTVRAEGADGRTLHLLPLCVLDFLDCPDNSVRNMSWHADVVTSRSR